MEWKKRRCFTYKSFSGYHVISKEIENSSLDTIEFLDTHGYIKNAHWQSSCIIVFVCKYYVAISNTLTCIFFLLLAVILSEILEKPERKDWVPEKCT